MCKSISNHEAGGRSYRSYYGRSGGDSNCKIHGSHWSHCSRQAEKWQSLHPFFLLVSQYLPVGDGLGSRVAHALLL